MEDVKEKRTVPRLILGDGNFSYAYALIKKHLEKIPDLPLHLIVTEYQSEPTLTAKHGELFSQHVKYLRSLGVWVLFEIDVRNLNLPKEIGLRQRRVHFNCPHTGDSFTSQLIASSFKNISTIQWAGDRIYMALVNDCYWQWCVYKIVQGSMDAGYKLMKARKFNQSRYPEYVHTETKEGKKNPQSKNLKEFIFEKTQMTLSELQRYYQTSNKVKIYLEKEIKDKSYFVISTDDDSSGYEEVIDNEVMNEIPKKMEMDMQENFLKLHESIVKEENDDSFNKLFAQLKENKGFDINYVFIVRTPKKNGQIDVSQQTLLHTAIEENGLAMVKRLLEEGAKVDIAKKISQTYKEQPEEQEIQKKSQETIVDSINLTNNLEMVALLRTCDAKEKVARFSSEEESEIREHMSKMSKFWKERFTDLQKRNLQLYKENLTLKSEVKENRDLQKKHTILDNVVHNFYEVKPDVHKVALQVQSIFRAKRKREEWLVELEEEQESKIRKISKDPNLDWDTRLTFFSKINKTTNLYLTPGISGKNKEDEVSRNFHEEENISEQKKSHDFSNLGYITESI